MPPATKKAAAKKAAAVKKTSKKSVASEEQSPAEARAERNAELGEQVADLRDNGEKSWAEIAEELEIGQGKAMLLYMYATTDDDDKISFKDDADLGRKVAKARKDGLSWGQIMARTGLGEGKLRSAWEAETGDSSLGQRIGKGGRFPSGEARPAKKTAKKATKAASKAARTQAAASAKGVEMPAAGVPLADFTLPQLQKRLNGKTVTVGRDNGKGVERIKVKNIKSVKDGEIGLVEQNTGKSRTILATQIKSATK